MLSKLFLAFVELLQQGISSYLLRLCVVGDELLLCEYIDFAQSLFVDDKTTAEFRTNSPKS